MTVTIDRPFTFWLRDTATDAVLFMGRVNDPSTTRG
ncbi:MAG: serpin family protein [Actinomycetota bacterium]|nr:serpin family protein [Actinomycetota bacterium]